MRVSSDELNRLNWIMGKESFWKLWKEEMVKFSHWAAFHALRPSRPFGTRPLRILLSVFGIWKSRRKQKGITKVIMISNYRVLNVRRPLIVHHLCIGCIVNPEHPPRAFIPQMQVCTPSTRYHLTRDSVTPPIPFSCVEKSFWPSTTRSVPKTKYISLGNAIYLAKHPASSEC